MERWIPEWSIRAFLLVFGTGIVVSALRVRAPSALHRAWTAAMAAMLLLPVWTAWGPSVTAPVLPVVRERAARIEIPLGALAPQGEAAQTAIEEPYRSAPQSPNPDWPQILLAVYLAGIAVMLTRLIRGTLQVRSMLRGVRQAEGFATSPLCAAPVTIGWLRPVPLLPDCWPAWPAAKLEAVLMHEREHARRRDPLVQWLALLNRCVFWFHPLAWWLERKLAALAEEACDAAVLAGGHAPQDYARYLIEMARSINEMGARIRWAGAVSFSSGKLPRSSGKLPRRIRRIMDASPVTAMSRAKSIASVSLCALMLATFLACNLSRPVSRAAGQFTMSEQDGRVRAALLQWQPRRQQSDASVWKAALNLTPSGAKELAADVKAHPYYPDHADNLPELVRYYQSQKDLSSLDALTLWFIGQHPDMRFSWGSRPEWDKAWDKDGYDGGRQLWTEQLKKQWESPFVYMNAAEFLSGNDNDQAERILLEGQRRFPSPALHWEVFLARHYAWALTGSAGQLPEGRMVLGYDESGAPPAQGPYAMKVRKVLLASNDVELLTRTVEQLQGNTPNLTFAQSLIERALSIQPDNQRAHAQRKSLALFSLQLRDKTDPGSLNDGDRMVLLQSQLAHPGVKDAEAKANELLTLAARNTKDPDYGTAIFLANMVLGEAALSRGDKAEAVRRLLAASDAPPTEFLRYSQIDMSLARKLVDAGERQAVSTFLDRCAKFNKAGKPLVEWAAEIEKGINPDLSPHFDGFRPAQ